MGLSGVAQNGKRTLNINRAANASSAIHEEEDWMLFWLYGNY